MLLTDVKSYLSRRGRASLADLAAHFTVQPDAMRGIIETWVAKGRVRHLYERLPCGSCGKCGTAASAADTTDVYEWIGSSLAAPRRPCADN